MMSVRTLAKAFRMTGMPSYMNRADSSGDLFPFIRKRFTGLAPNTGHRFPEPRSFDNAKHPFRFKSDETGAVWIAIGAEYLPFEGVEGLEFNVGTIQVDLEATPTSLRPRRQVESGRGPAFPMGTFRWGTREWNLAGERIP
jgi:hypothetical protein